MMVSGGRGSILLRSGPGPADGVLRWPPAWLGAGDEPPVVDLVPGVESAAHAKEVAGAGAALERETALT